MTNTPSNEAFNPDLSKSKIDKTDAQLTSNRQASDRQDVEPSTDIQANLETNIKGAKILDADTNPLPHVNDGDNVARQPDRRDQQGQAFDGGVNEENLKTTTELGEPRLASDDITDNNKYTNAQNAQHRSL